MIGSEATCCYFSFCPVICCPYYRFGVFCISIIKIHDGWRRHGGFFFEFSAVANNGRTIDFKQYEGMVVLVVNTAIKCGFTKQYDGLQELFVDYRDRGFVIIGFPCNQFVRQEPGTDEEIAEFCRLIFGVTFPLMSKIKVNSREAHPPDVGANNHSPNPTLNCREFVDIQKARRRCRFCCIWGFV